MKVTSWFLNFDFGGRARRSHYWANWFAWGAVFIALFAVMAVVVGPSAKAEFHNVLGGGLLGLVLLAALIAATVDGMAIIFRRAHDTNHSGWIWPLLLIPLVNLLPLYWLLIKDSDQGPNKYGPPVKQFYEPEAAPAV